MTPDANRADLTLSGLNLIPQAISIFDADLRLSVCNSAYRAMFGLPDPLTRPGGSFEDTIRFLVTAGEYGPVEDIEDAVRVRVEQARRFQPHYMERTRANGRTISVEGAPLAQGGWVAVYTDITEIRQQERLLRARSEELSGQVLANAERLAAANRQLAATNAALEEAQRILIAAEARTRQVTEMVPAHIAHVDPTLHYTFSNHQLGAVFPGAWRNVIGVHVVDALGPATWERVRPHMERAQAGEPQVFEIAHDDSGRRIRIALTPDRAGGGVYVLSTDVTAEAQAREAIQHAGRRALAAQLTSGLAHDFGNLLTIILALQDRLSRADLPPEAADDVAATLAAARRGTALLAGIGAITTPRTIQPRPVDLPDLLTSLAAMARPSLGEGVRLALDVDLPPGRVVLDPGPLQDSLLNLILNARDAMGAGGGCITLSARASGAWLNFAVTDEGPGFSPEALEKAIQPFYSTKPGRGSGLGLSMVYDQTKLAGGNMRIGNGATGGAEVRLRLPLRRVAPRMVLLVDDEATIRAHVRELLTGLGHTVIEAGSLAEAQRLLDLPDLGLVLSDIQLGDGEGTALITPTVPGLLMTSLPPEHPLRRDAPCPVLAKPVDPAQLALRLSEIAHG